MSAGGTEHAPRVRAAAAERQRVGWLEGAVRFVPVDAVRGRGGIEPDASLAPDDLRSADALHDFLARAFALARLRDAAVRGAPLRVLHADHKYLLMAHAPGPQKELGRMVAVAVPDIAAYASLFRRALGAAASRGGHFNALQHIAGYFPGARGAGSRARLLAAIEEYREGARALPVVIAELREAVDRYGIAYLRTQAYLRPYPPSLDGAVASFSG